MSKTVLFQTIQFSISTQFSSIWPIDRTLSGATTSGQSGLGSDAEKAVLCIPQSSSITGTSPSDYLVSYPGHMLWGQVLLLCKDVVGIFSSPSRLGHLMVGSSCKFHSYYSISMKMRLSSSLEMESASQVQILVQAVCISLYANILGKGMNLTIFPLQSNILSTMT